MSWLNDTLFGTKAKTSQYSTLGPEQKKVEDALAPQIQQGLKSGATPYGGKLVADMPSLVSEGWQQLSESLNNYNSQINKALIGQISGAPAYSFDPAGATKSWQETYAEPVMETWRQTVLPLVQESYNLPGVAYSTGRGRNVEQAANTYYSQNVAPSLFNWLQQGEQLGAASKENAAARQLQASQLAATLPQSQFSATANAASEYMQLQQPGLTAQYNEFLRTSDENNPWLTQALAYMGTPTTATVYQPAQQGVLQAGLQKLMGQATNAGVSAAGGIGSMISSMAMAMI